MYCTIKMFFLKQWEDSKDSIPKPDWTKPAIILSLIVVTVGVQHSNFTLLHNEHF